MGVALASRAAVLAVAVLAALTADISPNAASFDARGLTHPLGGAGDVLLSPLARWDAVWYLSIAWNGYGATGIESAFFPLYPLLVWVVGGGPLASPGTLLVAAYGVSLGAFAGALHLLHRLAEIELGRPAARATLLLLAFFPASLWFGAPYSESLFLLLSVGAFYAARTDRLAVAGACAGLASATRSAGIVLVLPLLMMSGWRRQSWWLALGPAGLAAYSAYLGLAHGDALAWLDIQQAWFREFAGPFGGVWDALVVGWRSFGDLGAAGATGELARRNVVDLPFLAFALVGLVGVWMRLPRPYGVYVLCALALPLSFPVAQEPLMSLPRFVSVLFPVFMWLAIAVRLERALVVSGLGLGLLTAWFATWEWVA